MANQMAFGAGFTGRLALGQKPLPSVYGRDYVATVRDLLVGDTTEWEGAAVRMLHPDGYGAARPIRIPMIIGAGGPKGTAVARQLGVGVINALTPVSGFGRSAVLTIGTVLDDGGEPGSDHALAAAGHAAGVVYHGAYLRGDVASMPGGDRWLAALEEFPESERHIAVHGGHLIEPNARDRLVVSGDILSMFGFARDAKGWHQHVEELTAGGATEVVYQPAGPEFIGN